MAEWDGSIPADEVSGVHTPKTLFPNSTGLNSTAKDCPQVALGLNALGYPGLGGERAPPSSASTSVLSAWQRRPLQRKLPRSPPFQSKLPPSITGDTQKYQTLRTLSGMKRRTLRRPAFPFQVSFPVHLVGEGHTPLHARRHSTGLRGADP